MVAAGKEGTIHALDRDTHEHLYAVSVTTRLNTDKLWEDGMEKQTDRVCPGLIGGVQWSGPAYNPVTNMLYVPAADWCDIIHEPVENSRGWLTAVNAGTGKVAWQYKSGRPMLAAVTSTATGVVFAGETTGDFRAFDGRSGKPLYKFTLGGVMTGGIASYEVGGKQYIATVSGAAASHWRADPGSSTLAIFALP